MIKQHMKQSNLVCACDHAAPRLRILRSVEFNYDLACKISALNISGDATVDLIITELLDRRTGRLLDPNSFSIVLAGENPTDVARWDRLFSEDQRRFMNRYKERAQYRAFKNRFQERLVFPVMLMHFAMAVRECRVSGRCAA